MLYSLNKYPLLSHEFINSYISDYDIYSYYIGKRFTLNAVFNSPLREDNTPSFGIIQNPEGRLIYNDFGNSNTGNAITFVQHKLKLPSYKDALIQIYIDLILNSKEISNIFTKPEQIKKKSQSKIEVSRQSFTKTDLDYWGRFNITKDILKLYEVSSIKHLIVNDYIYWTYTKENPMYVYKVYDKLKIYRPLALKKEKWFGSTTKNYIFGYKQLPDKGELLIITKSLKDVMCLRSLGYDAISPSSEGTLIPSHIIDDIKLRFTKILVFYDNDEQGIKSAEKIKKAYNINNIVISLDTKTKDISEYFEKYLKEKTIYFIKNEITNI